MGRPYSIQFNAVAVTAAQDFFELTAAATCSCVIHGWNIMQTSDVGDAQEEMLRLLLVRGHTTSGSGGSAATPTPLLQGGSAAVSAAEVNNTTIASAGTTVTLCSRAFNVRVGEDFFFPPELRPTLSPSARIVLRQNITPADSLTMSGTFYFEEV